MAIPMKQSARLVHAHVVNIRKGINGLVDGDDPRNMTAVLDHIANIRATLPATYKMAFGSCWVITAHMAEACVDRRWSTLRDQCAELCECMLVQFIDVKKNA